MTFAELEISSWSEFTGMVATHRAQGIWIYRGQKQSSWSLSTSLERALARWNVDLGQAPGIEKQLIRDFERRFRWGDTAHLHSDVLYCLTLMQHHGAPTRLIDCTYSPYVAAKFAIEDVSLERALWCFRGNWLSEATIKIVGDEAFRPRAVDKTQRDESFRPLYMDDSAKLFVNMENPFHLNERLTIQQGLFLCPGDVRSGLEDNLKAMDGWNLEGNVLKLKLKLDQHNLREFATELMRMNVSSAVLFPGLDGFSRTLGDHLFLYRELADFRTGESDFLLPHR